VIDYILEISFDARDAAIEEEVQARLFLTASSGSSLHEVNGTATIAAYFDTATGRQAARGALADIGRIELHDDDRERVDWLAQYQQSLQPILIGDDFIVAPDASLIPAGATRHALVIPQEQAFGTGSHETTALCIELLSAYCHPYRHPERSEGSPVMNARPEVHDTVRGLDVGSGSGILALALLRLGARKVIAFDHDADAYGALRDNRTRNGIDAERMPLFIGSIEALRGGVFDVVTMNIVPEVIIPLLPSVVPHVGGTLILSGILSAKRDEVVRACAGQRLRLDAERERGEWWAGAFRRTGNAKC
jgi:ribosomal protein L11 methyltransferase